MIRVMPPTIIKRKGIRKVQPNDSISWVPNDFVCWACAIVASMPGQRTANATNAERKVRKLPIFIIIGCFAKCLRLADMGGWSNT